MRLDAEQVLKSLSLQPHFNRPLHAHPDIPTKGSAMRAALKRSGIPALLIGAIVGTTISIGAVSYAQQSREPAPHATTPARPGSITAGIHELLENLARQGTITAPQAEAVQRQADNGTIDPKTLVASGVVTDAQMHTIARSILELKQSDR
jgi:hypothetical protein